MLKDMISYLVNISGMTQLQISQKTGVPQSAISRIYTGAQQEICYSSGKEIEILYRATVDAPSVPETEKRAA